MADFKVNDIIQNNLTLESTKYIYPKYLVIEVMQADYLLFGLTGANRKVCVKVSKEYVNENYKLIAHYVSNKKKKEKSSELKPNCYVKLLNARNKDNIGKTAKVISFINPAVKVKEHYDDCIIQIEGCLYYHHIPKSWLERIPKPNRPQRTKQTIEAKVPQLVISRLGNDKIVIEDVSYQFNKDGKIYVAINESKPVIARCHKRDEFDEEIGILVALARKYGNKLLETFALNQGKFEDILDLVKLVSGEEKNDKQCK